MSQRREFQPSDRVENNADVRSRRAVLSAIGAAGAVLALPFARNAAAQGSDRSAAYFQGVGRTTIQYLDPFGTPLGGVLYEKAVLVVLAPPLNSPSSGRTENNPFNVRIFPANPAEVADEGHFEIHSSTLAFAGSATSELLLQYWTFTFDGANLVGTLTDAHEAEAAVANFLNAGRLLVEGRPEFGTIPW